MHLRVKFEVCNTNISGVVDIDVGPKLICPNISAAVNIVIDNILEFLSITLNSKGVRLTNININKLQ